MLKIDAQTRSDRLGLAPRAETRATSVVTVASRGATNGCPTQPRRWLSPGGRPCS